MGRIDDMGGRIDELEKSISDLMEQVRLGVFQEAHMTACCRDTDVVDRTKHVFLDQCAKV